MSVNFGTLTEGESESLEISISNIGGESLFWDISGVDEWYSVTPSSGTDSSTLSVVTKKTVQDGTYVDAFTVTSNGGYETIQVSCTIERERTPAIIWTSTDQLDFEHIEQGTNSIISMTLENQGEKKLNWVIENTSNWFNVSPSSGSNDETLIITLMDNLSPGNYSSDFKILSNAGNVEVSVTAIIDETAPILKISNHEINFGNRNTGQDKTIFLNISNIGKSILKWNITEIDEWYTIHPTSGINNETVKISLLDTTPSGMYSDDFIINSNDRIETIRIKVNISETIEPPQLVITPPAIDFGPVEEGVICSKIVTITDDHNNLVGWRTLPHEKWFYVNPVQSKYGGSLNISTISTNEIGKYDGNIVIVSDIGVKDVQVALIVKESVTNSSDIINQPVGPMDDEENKPEWGNIMGISIFAVIILFTGKFVLDKFTSST